MGQRRAKKIRFGTEGTSERVSLPHLVRRGSLFRRMVSSSLQPQSLACPRCGCVLAHIDTHVLRKCPGCGLVFTGETQPVPESEAPRAGRVRIPEPTETPEYGCARLIWASFGISWAQWLLNSDSVAEAIIATIFLVAASCFSAIRPNLTWRRLAIRTSLGFLVYLAIGFVFENPFSGLAVLLAGTALWQAVKYFRERRSV